VRIWGSSGLFSCYQRQWTRNQALLQAAAERRQPVA
jgi:hypothetical protein